MRAVLSAVICFGICRHFSWLSAGLAVRPRFHARFSNVTPQGAASPRSLRSTKQKSLSWSFYATLLSEWNSCMTRSPLQIVLLDHLGLGGSTQYSLFLRATIHTDDLFRDYKQESAEYCRISKRVYTKFRIQFLNTERSVRDHSTSPSVDYRLELSRPCIRDPAP